MESNNALYGLYCLKREKEQLRILHSLNAARNALEEPPIFL